MMRSARPRPSASGRQAPAPALLIIAGAGTGKTATLAHRVAALVTAGVDPARILLLTFTRRAALEMTRRAECESSAETMRLPWSGTFHAVANRLLREFAMNLGLARDFSVLDRGDSADLLDLIRQERGLAASRRRFPRKDTCLAIYSRRVNGGRPLDEVLRDAFPWCEEWAHELAGLFRAYAERKQAEALLDYDDLLLYWHALMQEPQLAAGGRPALRPCARRRVPGRQSPAGRDRARIETWRIRNHRRRRRCAGDLLVPRGIGREHPRVSGALRSAGDRHRARVQLPLDPAGARCGERADRGSVPRLPEVAGRCTRRRRATAARDGRGRSRGRPTTSCSRCSAAARRARRSCARPCCSAVPITAIGSRSR